uniref:hypothetical protein n=1 Tax=Mycolicibacterium poriferae TaxID=39694 RepID=UPI00321A60A3
MKLFHSLVMDIYDPSRRVFGTLAGRTLDRLTHSECVALFKAILRKTELASSGVLAGFAGR